MEQEIFTSGTEMQYPLLLIPKKCNILETTCDVTDEVFMNLNIKSATTDGNEMCLYSGLCKIRLKDSCNVIIKQTRPTSPPDTTDINQIQIVKGNNQSSYPPYSQSQVWIDSACSSYVYNSYDASESQAKYCVPSSHITVEQHNTNIAHNVYNCAEPIHYSLTEEFDHKKIRNIQAGDTNTQNSSGDLNKPYEDDEFQCGVFLSQLSEKIINDKEASTREEMQYFGLQSENDTFKQLMSSDIQSLSKQQKTILFLGQDSHFGQTIQKIAFNDLSLDCVPGGEIDQEVIYLISYDAGVEGGNYSYSCFYSEKDDDEETFEKEESDDEQLELSSKPT